MARITPKIALSAAFLFVLPVIGGQVQGYPTKQVVAPNEMAQSVHFKSSSWPSLQQAAMTTPEQRG